MSKRSLLQKYDIPIGNLDFSYIGKCTDPRRIEKIYHILESGEEGYYPDLEKCAENKLRELKPDSRFFRMEAKILKRDDLEKCDWLKEGEPLIKWSDEVKIKDNFLSTLTNNKTLPEIDIPPIRQFKKKINSNAHKSEISSDTNNTQKKTNESIASTDYAKWDKFDADTELLKMDLDEERNKELTEKMNKKNLEETKKSIKNSNKPSMDKTIIQKLTNVEKELLSISYKDRGNDFFNAKEFESSVTEYTKSLDVYSSAAGYNNRAVAYLKLLDYGNCINDCDKCLQIEPKNIKALLRKGQALLGLDKRRDAYEVYSHIISIDPSNIFARNHLNNLKKQLPDLPPAEATRIAIQDEMILEPIEPRDKEIKAIKMNTSEKDKIDCIKTEINDSVQKKKSDSTKVKKENSQNKTSPRKISNGKEVDMEKNLIKKEKSKDSNKDVKKIVKKKSVYNPPQEDLSKLIIPKKLIKNNIMTRTLETMKKSVNLQNKNENFNEKKSNCNLISSEISLPDVRNQNKYDKNKILIEEIF